ncbi:MAG: adenylate cyclase [Carbonactinosporaceae bacterium]
MATEYEARILDVDIPAVERRLGDLGASLTAPRRLMRRCVYDVEAGARGRWIRLRDDGEKIMVTHKRIVHEGIGGTEEREALVPDFDAAHAALSVALVPRAYQENYRTSYVLDGVMVEIDEWPLIPPYVEVEGPSAEAVTRVAGLLGYTDLTTDHLYGIYRRYGQELADHRVLAFRHTGLHSAS